MLVGSARAILNREAVKSYAGTAFAYDLTRAPIMADAAAIVMGGGVDRGIQRSLGDVRSATVGSFSESPDRLGGSATGWLSGAAPFCGTRKAGWEGLPPRMLRAI